MGEVLRVTGLNETIQTLKAAPSRIPQTIASIVRRRLEEAVQYGRTRYLTGGTTSDRLAARTGRLRSSFAYTLSQQGTTTYGRLGYLNNPPSWASVHEGAPDGRTSTTIRPRRAQYLAIPLTDEARQVGSPRQYPEALFARRSRRGNLLLFQRQGNTITPIYLLASEVVIPARPAVRPTVERYTPLIRDDIDAAIRRLLLGRF